MRTAPNSRAAWRSLVDAASTPYRKAGRYGWHFAQGKLGGDPIFKHLHGGFLPLAGRPLALWVERLQGLGFEVDSEPMNGRLPFANVLLVARVVAPAQP